MGQVSTTSKKEVIKSIDIEKELQEEIEKLSMGSFIEDDEWIRELKVDKAFKNIKLIDLKLTVLNGVEEVEEVNRLFILRKKIILETELI